MFSELDIEDRLQWKRHQMIFAMQAAGHMDPLDETLHVKANAQPRVCWWF